MRCFIAFAASNALMLLVLLVGQTAVRAEAAGQLTLSTLLSRFAAMPGLEASFHEEKHITLLEVPLVSEGTIHFAPPSKLLRQITAPAKATVLVSDGQLRFSDGNRSDQVDLDQNPTVRHLVESFIYLLAGDEAALQRIYTTSLTSRPEDGPEAWELVLTPRPAEMQRLLIEVRLRGAGVVLREMRVREASGDQTVTTFSNVDPARRYSAAEQAQLFRLPSP